MLGLHMGLIIPFDNSKALHAIELESSWIFPVQVKLMDLGNSIF